MKKIVPISKQLALGVLRVAALALLAWFIGSAIGKNRFEFFTYQRAHGYEAIGLLNAHIGLLIGVLLTIFFILSEIRPTLMPRFSSMLQHIERSFWVILTNLILVHFVLASLSISYGYILGILIGITLSTLHLYFHSMANENFYIIQLIEWSIFVAVLFAIFGLLVGAILGGNYIIESNYAGLQGYESTGLLGSHIGIVLSIPTIVFYSIYKKRKPQQ